MSKCTNLTKSGIQCTRNSLPNSKYCRQHREIKEEKQHEIKEGSSNRTSNIPLTQITTRTSTSNTYINKVFEPNVLKIVYQFNPIPEGTSKLLTLPTKQKWELLEANFHVINTKMKFPIPNENYLNCLYLSLIVKGKNIGNIEDIKWLLRHEVYYDEIYLAFASKATLYILTEFLIYLYEQKAFRFFYVLYPIYKERLSETGHKFNYHHNYGKVSMEIEKNVDIISLLVCMDIQTEQEIYLDEIEMKKCLSKYTPKYPSEYTSKYIYFFGIEFGFFPPFFTSRSFAIFLKVRKMSKENKLWFYDFYFPHEYRTPDIENISDLAQVYTVFKSFDIYKLFEYVFDNSRFFTRGHIHEEVKVPTNLTPKFIYHFLDVLFNIIKAPLTHRESYDQKTRETKEIIVENRVPIFVKSESYYEEKQYFLDAIHKLYPKLDLKKYQDLIQNRESIQTVKIYYGNDITEEN